VSGVWRQRLATVINLRPVCRCVLVLLPIFVLSSTTSDALWLRAAIMVVATLIGVERVGLAPLGVVLQGAAAGLGYLLLYFALLAPPLFVLACACLAAGAIGLSAYGRKLRSLGNFIFIPALYLACETAEGSSVSHYATAAVQFLPYMLVCMLPVLLLTLYEHHQAGRMAGVNLLYHHLRLRRDLDLGERRSTTEAMVAVALAVAVAASMVEYWHLGHGQWVVWSAASVVTGDAASSQIKLRDRAIGALVGVPGGVVLGWLLPHTSLVYALVAIASVLTLVAFRRYVHGFGARCACVAAALIVADQGTSVAAERVVNVLLGGATGVVFVFGLHFLARQARPSVY